MYVVQCSVGEEGLAFKRPSMSECHQSKEVLWGGHRNSRWKTLFGKVYGNHESTMNNVNILPKEAKIIPWLHSYFLLQSAYSLVASRLPFRLQTPASEWPIGVQSSAIARTAAANESPGLFGGVRPAPSVEFPGAW